MDDDLYADAPRLYDAIQSDWDYDRDVAVVERAAAAAGDRLLEVGCGTGEHARRFAAAGFDVTAVDPAGAAIGLAREKAAADGVAVDFVRGALPVLPVDAGFDVVAAIRGVINHLPERDLGPTARALYAALDGDGVAVFDASPLPPEGVGLGMDVGRVDGGLGGDPGDGDAPDYVQIARHRPREDSRLRWQSVVFGADGTVVADERAMTPLADETVVRAFAAAGFDVETREGYGPSDERTVFVAVA